ELGRQYLDRHRPAVLQVFGQVHSRHPPAAELALDRVPPGEGGAHFGEHARHGGARARGTLDDMSQGGAGPEAEPFARLFAQPRVTSPTSLSPLRRTVLSCSPASAPAPYWASMPISWMSRPTSRTACRRSSRAAFRWARWRKVASGYTPPSRTRATRSR